MKQTRRVIVSSIRVCSMNQQLNACVKSKHFNRAVQLFDEMPQRSTITYNIVICGIMSRSFAYFKTMMLENIRPDEITFNALLRSCTDHGVINCQQTHCFVTKLGFVSNCFVASPLVDLYDKVGLLTEARRAFDEVLRRDLVLWNVMISCYASKGLASKACDLFNTMSLDGVVGDAYTFCSLLSCGFVGTCDLAKQVHCAALKVSFSSDLLVASALVDMYVKNGGLDDGRRAFDETKFKNVVTWNIMIVGYGRDGDGNEAVKLLRDMFREGFAADEVTFASVFSSCAQSSLVREITQVHDFTIKAGLEFFRSVSNSLVNAYSKCGNLADASRCFSSSSDPDLITWTSMINACWTNGEPEQAIDVFEKMISDGVTPDHIAFLSVLSACSHGGLLAQGLRYLTLMSSRYHITPNQDHYTCIVDLLGRCGSLDEALVVLSSMLVEFKQDSLAAFVGACKIHGRMDIAKRAAEELRWLDPNEPANQTLLSSIYASTEEWYQAGEIRKGMERTCSYKTPGCSLII
ncbi:unnamed protein product [Rhodiola kirilowii]